MDPTSSFPALEPSRSFGQASSSSVDRPVLWGISHLKLATTNIKRTQDFYCDIMGMEYLPQYDYYSQQLGLFAVMIRLKHTEAFATLIELRHNEAQALAQQGMDPVTYAVRSRESLDRWKRWFDFKGVQCSDVHAFQSLKGWVLTASDPDGRVVRIYSDEKHERVADFDIDDF